MRSLMSFIFFMVLTSMAFASSPFRPAEHARFMKLENHESMAKIAHDFSEDAVVSGETLALTGTIPADSIITQVSVVVMDSLTSASDNTVALGCESTADLDAANDLTDDADNSVEPGTPRVNDEDTWVYTSDGCVPTLSIGVGTTGITAGRLMYFIKYIQREFVNIYSN